MMNRWLIGAEDAYGYLFSIWHTQQALLAGSIGNTLYTRWLFYPHGVSMRYDAMPFYSVLFLPLQLIAGPVTVYDTVVVFTYVVTWLSLYVFLHYLSHHRPAAILASTVFTFGYFRTYHTAVGHLDWMGTMWLGVFLFFSYRAFVHGLSIRDVVLSALIFSLQAYTDYRMLIVLAVIAMFVGMRGIVIHGKLAFPRIAIQALVFVLISTCLVLPYVWQFRDLAGTVMRDDGTGYLDLAQLILPLNQYNRSAFLGLIFPVFVSLLIVAYRQIKPAMKQELRFWGLVCAVILTIAIGHEVRVFGTVVIDPPVMPYSVIQNTPFLRLFYRPARLAIIFHLAVAIALAPVLGYYWDRWKRSARYRVFLCLAIMLPLVLQIAWVYPIPVSVVGPTKLTEYLKLRRGAVLPYPLTDYQSALSDVVWHGRPLTGGYVSYIDRDTRHWLQETDVLRKILDCQRVGTCPPFNQSDTETVLNGLDIRDIVIYEYRSYPEAVAMFRRSFPDATTQEFDSAYVITLDPDE